MMFISYCNSLCLLLREKQEMSKGGATKAFVTGAGSNNWTFNGGWAFNPNHYLNYRPDPLEPGGGNGGFFLSLNY